MDVVVDHLGGDHPAEGIESGLRSHVGGEARRVGLRPDRADVDDVALLARPHRRQQRQDQPHRTEVVELDRALEVVVAVVGEGDRAADRTAGVVDEDVDVAVVGQHLLGHPLDVLDVGEVALVDVGGSSAGDDLVFGLLQLVEGAGDQEHGPARVGDLDRGRFADPRGGAGDEDDFAPDRRRERAVAEEVGVEVALPVIPDPVRVALQRRHLDPAAFERFLRLGRVEAGRVVDVGEHLRRQSELVQRHLRCPLRRREELQRRPHRPRRRLGHVAVQPHRHLRSVGGLGEEVDHLAGRMWIRIGEVEGAPVQPRLVSDVVDRGGDVVDRDDVDLAALDPDDRQPGRGHPPQPLQGLEEVVGPVDLVDLPGARVADHDPRPVDPPGPLALVADQPLGLVLGAEVGVVVELFGLVEHVLDPDALVEAGGGNRADLVEAARLERPAELDRVARPLDVGDLLRLGIGGQVVDRGEVEEVVDFPPHRHQVLLRDTESGLGEIAGDRDDPGPVGAEAGPQLLQAAARPGPHQGVDRPLPLQQFLDQIAADETRGAGYEIAHRPAGYLP